MLDETILLLNSVMAEIQFSKADIVKIISEISFESAVKNLSFLENLSDIPVYEDFRSAWQKSINLFPYYKREEKERLLQLGSFLGTTDVDSQIDTLKLYLSFFEVYRFNSQNEYEKYGKASSLFGFFIGASIFILLL